VRVHGGVEGGAADDLVEVRGGDGAGVDERVEALDDELRALEAEHGGDVGCGGVEGAGVLGGGEGEEGGEGEDLFPGRHVGPRDGMMGCGVW